METALREALNNILDLREQMGNKKAELNEAVKGVAERFDRKPAEINQMATLIEKESQVGDVIRTQRGFLDEVEGYFDV